MKSQKTRHITRKLMEKHHLTQEQVDNILTAPFDFQTQIMRGVVDPKNRVFPSLRIPNFGLFYVPKYIQDRFKEEDEYGTISDKE